MSTPTWMNDPSLSNISPEKLQFLQKMVFESKNLSKKELLPFFMSISKLSKEKNIQFTKEEMDAIILVLKAHSTPEELEKINKVMQMKK